MEMGDEDGRRSASLSLSLSLSLCVCVCVCLSVCLSVSPPPPPEVGRVGARVPREIHGGAGGRDGSGSRSGPHGARMHAIAYRKRYRAQFFASG